MSSDDKNNNPAETPAVSGMPEEVVSGEPHDEIIARRHGMFGGQGGDTSGYGGLRKTIYAPPPASRPYGGYFDEIADVLVEVLGTKGVTFDQAVPKVTISGKEMTLRVPREHLLDVAEILRDDQDLRFEMCMSVSGVHYPEDTGDELHVFYALQSLTHERRVNLEVSCSEDDARIPSLIRLYPGVNWHERETWDMFGVIFEGHDALTRILMPDDWPGHPQRKDYPLGGISVEYKGAHVPPPDTRRIYR